MKGKIVIDQGMCKECHLCIAFCTRGCIVAGKDYNPKGYRAVLDSENGECNGCAQCAVICPETAIEVYRE